MAAILMPAKGVIVCRKEICLKQMTAEAREARRKYNRDYYAKHREERLAYRKKWNAAHPEKQKEYVARFWARKAQAHLDRQESEENGD